MPNLTQLSAKRSKIASEINAIKSMRKGTLSSQFQKVSHKDGSVVEKGPYYVLTKKAPGGRTISKSISAQDVPRIQKEVDNYKRFRELSDEYVDVCEKISILADGDDEAKKN